MASLTAKEKIEGCAGGQAGDDENALISRFAKNRKEAEACMDPIDEDVLVSIAILGGLTPHSVSEMDRLVRLEQEGYVKAEPGPPITFALTVEGRAVVEAKKGT
jgi:hypothetical protein